MNQLRIIATLIFISLMAFMSYLWQTAPQPVVVNDQTERQKPDFIAVDIKLTQFGQDGLRESQLSANKMEYYKQLDQATFTQPLIVLQPEQNKGRWRISSNYGVLYNNQQLVLEQDVTATNLTLTDLVERIEGQKIDIDLKYSTMFSQQKVNLFGDGMMITGSDMLADLTQEQSQQTRKSVVLSWAVHTPVIAAVPNFLFGV